MARPKRSAAAAATKSLRGSKSTSALKKAAAAGGTPISALSFKTSKITQWSETKKKAVETGVSVETAIVKNQVMEEVEVVEVKDKEVNETEPTRQRKEKATRTGSAPVTPRKTRKKRAIEDVDETTVTKKLKVCESTSNDSLEVPKLEKPKSLEETPVVAISTEAQEDSQPSEVVSSDPVVFSSPTAGSALYSDASTAITEPEEEKATDSPPQQCLELPKAIDRLVSIHKSIVTLLLLHYATASRHQPAMLASYLPQLSRNAATDVSLLDLQRIVSLSQHSLRLVHLETRGNGLELVNGISAKVSSLAAEFKAHVLQWWGKKAHSDAEEDLLNSIELAPIQSQGATTSSPSSHAAAKASLLSKGQRRLLDLKSFKLTKGTGSESSPVKKENVPTGGSIKNRNSSLMERLRAKAEAAKAAPAAPAPEVLERRAGLQALESIIPILLQLTTPSNSFSRGTKFSGPSTTSFPLHTVIANVKNSLPTPIGNQEIERSLRLLAGEVASDFVKIVEWKGGSTGNPLVGVVFDVKGRSKVETWRYVDDTETAI